MIALRLGPVFLAILGSIAAANAVAPAPHGKATGCEDLSSIPLNYGIDYNMQIRPIFKSCVGCHIDPAPDGDLDLTLAPDTLVNVASAQDAALIRVIPANALQSLLFQKVNCTDPDVGTRMPPPFGGLPLEDQALLYDWIEQGAQPAEASDWIFRGNFESTR